MKTKKFKMFVIIATLTLVTSGCGSSSEGTYAKDCNSAKSKMVSLFNGEPKLPEDIIIGYKFAAGALYPVMENPEVKAITEGIANTELGSTAQQNYSQMINIFSKVKSLAVLCGFDSELNQ